METFIKVVGTIVVALLVAAGIAVVLAYPTKWVVDYLFTQATLLSLFGVAQLTVWKALWLNFICTVLFKGSSSSSSKS